MSQFLIHDNPGINDSVVLSSEEAHHLRDVFRMREGDEVRLFNGAGNGYKGKIEILDRNRVSVRILEKWSRIPDTVFIDAAVALLPRDGMLETVQRVTEFGIRKLRPLKTDRSIVKKDPNYDQWKKTALAACKQSGQLSMPEFNTPISLKELIQDFKIYDLVLFAHQDGEWIRNVLEAESTHNVKTILIIIGPEGGFNDSEIQLIEKAGACKTALGRYIFRSEVAAAFLSSVLSYRFGAVNENRL